MIWRPLRVLLRKEFLQIRRDAVILRMLLVMPMIQLLVLANVATFEVKTAALWIVDQDRTAMASDLVRRFTSSGRFRIAGLTSVAEPGEDALLTGDANAILVIPTDFERNAVRRTPTMLQVVLNAENGSQAGVIQSYAVEIINRFAADAANSSTLGSGQALRRSQPVIEIRTRAAYNPSLDYKRFMVPGILVQLITLVGTLMTALNIVREKEAGTLDQLNVTPIRPAVFIAAKLIPLWVIGMMEFVVGLGIAVGLFHVPLLGSIWLLMSGAALYLLAALGVGLWVSTVSETQQQALFVTFTLIMVYILMSGLFTPVRAMPGWAQLVAQMNPLMHFIAMMRSVMLKGAGVTDVWQRLLALAVLGSTILALAIGRYRKRVS